MSFDPFTTARRLTNTELVNFSAIPRPRKSRKVSTENYGSKKPGSAASLTCFRELRLASFFSLCFITNHKTRDPSI